MSQFKLDADTGDLVRENGSFVRVTGAEEIAQHVRVKLRLIRGECFMDRTLGIRYFSEEQADGAVFAKGTSLDDIGGEFRFAALDTPGVTAIFGMSFPAHPRLDITSTVFRAE